MDAFYDDILINATELIKNRLFFITIKSNEQPNSTACTHFFTVDKELVYENFFNDFGPLNIAMLFHYCTKLNKKLQSVAFLKKKIVHYTSANEEERVNAAFLACSYAIIYLNYTPERACEALANNNSLDYINFRDASAGIPYTISLKDCLNAVYKALQFGFFNFDDFNHVEYEYFERVENGDLNWIIPGKFLAFCGPRSKTRVVDGYPLHSPETYISYFRRNSVTTVIRLNKKMYDAAKFTNAGFIHKDLYFIDGSTPSDRIVNQFIDICEETDGAVAVHCKAGLGRTGSLIACYIMKHYKLTAHEAIAWIRICRPGSIIGHQQNWLESKQMQLWKAGDDYHAKIGLVAPIVHSKGIYTYSRGVQDNQATVSRVVTKKNDVSGILEKVDTMQLEDEDNTEEDGNNRVLTQGDCLNQIKVQRRVRQPRQVTSGPEKKVCRARLFISHIDSAAVLRGSKMIAMGIKDSGASTSRAITKRNGIADRQVALRRAQQHKSTVSTIKSSAAGANGQAKMSRARYIPSTNLTSIKVEVTGADGNSSNANAKAVESKVVKRSKRSLTVEKEKLNSRSVKVLRRSHPQTTVDAATKSISKLLLPHGKKNQKSP